MLQHASPQLSFGQVIYFTANALIEAFPSFKHLSRGDITLGLALVALSHSVDKLYQHANENPILHVQQQQQKEPLLHDYYLKRYNPENVSYELLQRAMCIVKFANLAYYPEAYLPSNHAQKLKHEKLLAAFSEQDWQQLPAAVRKTSTNTTNCTTTTVCTSPSISHFEYVYSIDTSSHLQIPFVLFLDHQHHRIMLSVRGTQDMMDIMTDFHFVPSTLSCHKYYKEYVAPWQNAKEQVIGYVHAGYYSTAKWLFQQIRPYLHMLWLAYPEYSIFTTGHSLGGSVACLVAILLREQFLSRQFQLDALPKHKYSHEFIQSKCTMDCLPRIECMVFAPAACFSKEISTWAQSFTTSFVVGADVVVRFAPGQAELLRLEVMNSGWEEKAHLIEKEFYEFHSYLKKV